MSQRRRTYNSTESEKEYFILLSNSGWAGTYGYRHTLLKGTLDNPSINLLDANSTDYDHLNILSHTPIRVGNNLAAVGYYYSYKLVSINCTSGKITNVRDSPIKSDYSIPTGIDGEIAVVSSLYTTDGITWNTSSESGVIYKTQLRNMVKLSSSNYSLFNINVDAEYDYDLSMEYQENIYSIYLTVSKSKYSSLTEIINSTSVSYTTYCKKYLGGTYVDESGFPVIPEGEYPQYLIDTIVDESTGLIYLLAGSESGTQTSHFIYELGANSILNSAKVSTYNISLSDDSEGYGATSNYCFKDGYLIIPLHSNYLLRLNLSTFDLTYKYISKNVLDSSLGSDDFFKIYWGRSFRDCHILALYASSSGNEASGSTGREGTLYLKNYEYDPKTDSVKFKSNVMELDYNSSSLLSFTGYMLDVFYELN